MIDLTLGQLAGSIVLGTGLVLSQKLASAQDAIRARSSQKAVAIQLGISESRLAKKLDADSDAVLTVRDLDRMDEDIQREFHLRELIRLGLPESIKKSLKVAAKVQQLQRSA